MYVSYQCTCPECCLWCGVEAALTLSLTSLSEDPEVGMSLGALPGIPSSPMLTWGQGSLGLSRRGRMESSWPSDNGLAICPPELSPLLCKERVTSATANSQEYCCD